MSEASPRPHVGRVKVIAEGQLRPFLPLRRVYMVPVGQRVTSTTPSLWWADTHGLPLTDFDRHDAEHYGLVVPEEAIEHSTATCWCMRRSA